MPLWQNREEGGDGLPDSRARLEQQVLALLQGRFHRPDHLLLAAAQRRVGEAEPPGCGSTRGPYAALPLELQEAIVDPRAKDPLESREVERHRLAGDACAADLDPEQLGAYRKTPFLLEHPGVERRLETVDVAAHGIGRRTPPDRLDLLDDETPFRVFTDPVGAPMKQDPPPGVAQIQPEGDLASVGGISRRGRRLDPRMESLP